MSSSTSKKKYSKEDIKEAVSGIKEKVYTVNGAARKFGIPFTTLRHRVTRVKNSEILNVNYSEKSVTEAISHIKDNGMSIYAASRKFKIPESTLRNRLRGRHEKIHGSDKVLSVEDESQLSEWIVLCARSGYPKTKIQIRKTAAEIAKYSSKKTIQKRNTNGRMVSIVQ